MGYKREHDHNNPLHTLLYDIIDEAGMINQQMYHLAEHIDRFGNLPNSLQSMLGKIYRYEGKTQAEIAAIYHLDMKNTIRYVNELYKRGFVKKVDVDHKRKEIYLTEEGYQVNQHFMVERGRMLDKIMEEIPQETLRQTGKVLCKIRRLMRDYNDKMKDKERTVK
ncbi:hypothetical protein HZI73_11305 [Vallitalea pronyensis]|uniref:HTH marR-type domain-containing protein n=1 Tax=Vallitalea pronyensis TaxID=1348613 RepID=A0A8J8SGJ6_9FIRM|nr:hypothetical protein [Vallitalea pronyensis]QUI22840.1 hypothetical protein HZI73_11305 [Vallitalea pronyensis]